MVNYPKHGSVLFGPSLLVLFCYTSESHISENVTGTSCVWWQSDCLM